MTRRIEDRAKSYLLHEFKHPQYSFEDAGSGKGFDLWIIGAGGIRQKAELKAHSGVYRRPSNLFERLIFSTDGERKLFEKGETVIVRLFLGENPIRVFVVTNKILGLGAQLTSEARYILRGEIDYNDTYTELT
jgi:hypothetical protein